MKTKLLTVALVLAAFGFFACTQKTQPMPAIDPLPTWTPVPTATLDLTCDLQAYIQRLQSEYTEPPLQGEPVKLDDGSCYYIHSPIEGAETMDLWPNPETCGTGTSHTEWQ